MPALSAPGILYTLRLHWKKSTAAAIALLGGGYYASDRYRAHCIRRVYCRRAKAYGEEYLSNPNEDCRRVVVFLNPAVDNHNPRKLFQKNVAPILHIAGLDVTVVESEYEGHLRTLMGYMDRNLSGIVVAGGDGSVQEAVTGLLRRRDEASISSVPLGIIPMGKSNSLASRLFESKASQVQRLCDAAFTVVLGKTQSVDVMSLKSENSSQPGVFSLGRLHWGVFRDTDRTVDKYWWSGRLRGLLAYLWPTVQETWPRLRNVSVTVPDSSSSKLSAPGKDLSETEKTAWFGRNLDTTAVEIQAPLGSSDEARAITVKIWPQSLDKSSFIGYGWRKHVLRRPPTDLPVAYQLSCEECRLQIPDDEVSWFTIDGEMYEAQSVNIKLLPKKLKIFVPER